jgi:hypothetical protein
MADSAKARLVSRLRARHQPATSEEEPELAEAARAAAAPNRRAERRPSAVGEKREPVTHSLKGSVNIDLSKMREEDSDG